MELCTAAYKTNAILYAGTLGSIPVYKAAESIAEQLDIAIIDKTARGQFLLSPDFRSALERIVTSEFPGSNAGVLTGIMDTFLEGPPDSLWRITSVEFAGSIQGSVLPLVTNATTDSVFFKDEIASYLNNGNQGQWKWGQSGFFRRAIAREMADGAVGTLRQFRMFYDQAKPIGVAFWATVNDEVEQRLAAGTTRLRPQDWKSGERLWVVEVIAPFGGAEEMVKDLKAKVFPTREMKFLAVGAAGWEVREL